MIVEDEPIAGRYLEAMLVQTGRVEVVGRAHNADWAMTVCSSAAPDGVFLDIRMPGEDGCALAERLALLPKPPLIVFATALPEHALHAYRLNAVDYLLKPLQFAQVLEAVGRLESIIAREEANDGFFVPSSLDDFAASDDRLPVKCLRDDMVKLVPRQDILAAIAQGRRTWICTASAKFATYYPLNRLEEWLRTDSFIRVSRQAIVNLRGIQEVIHFGDRLYQIRLGDSEGTCLTASRTGARNLAKLLRPPL